MHVYYRTSNECSFLIAITPSSLPSSSSRRCRLHMLLLLLWEYCSLVLHPIHYYELSVCRNDLSAAECLRRSSLDNSVVVVVVAVAIAATYNKTPIVSLIWRTLIYFTVEVVEEIIHFLIKRIDIMLLCFVAILFLFTGGSDQNLSATNCVLRINLDVVLLVVVAHGTTTPTS
jgi:hypothetical protein